MIYSLPLLTQIKAIPSNVAAYLVRAKDDAILRAQRKVDSTVNEVSAFQTTMIETLLMHTC